MSKILDFLRQPRTTARELREARDGLSVSSAEELVNQLEARRRKSLLDGSSEKDIENIEKQIATANREVERTVAAIEELTTRIAEAEEGEKRAQIEQRHHDGLAIQKSMLANYIEMGELAERLASMLHAHEQARRELLDINQVVRDSGRPDLTVADPWNVFHQQTGWPQQPNHYPTQFSLPGYRPRHPDGSALSRMKDVRL